MFKRIVAVLLVVFVAALTGAIVRADDVEGEDHGHFRVAHFAVDAPNVDVFVDGEAVLEDWPYFTVSDYLEVEPGTYSVAIAPTGEGMDAAIIGPMDVEVEAGHSYTAIAYGQLADESFTSLILNETHELEEAGLEEAVAPVILFQGISEVPAVDIYANGALFLENIPFGGFHIINFPLVEVPITITVHGDPDTVVLQETFFGVPNTLALAALMGSFPDNYGRVVVNTTHLSAFEFLAGASASPVVSFDTLVQAITTLITSGASVPDTDPDSTFFAPTDAAFAALPEGALLVDPGMIARILLYHGVQGPYTTADMLAGMDETGTTTVTTALGEDLTITAQEGGLFINDSAQIIYPDIRTSDGYIHIINQVLMPPEA